DSEGWPFGPPQVKEPAVSPGAGMNEFHKAVTQSRRAKDAAIQWLRKQGLAKADKKASRVAAEGRIGLAQNGGKVMLVEVNCETDFVAKDENFVRFTDTVAQAALAAGTTDVEALKDVKLAGGESVEEARTALVQKCGENVQVRRIAAVDSGNTVAAYVH